MIVRHARARPLWPCWRSVHAAQAEPPRAPHRTAIELGDERSRSCCPASAARRAPSCRWCRPANQDHVREQTLVHFREPDRSTVSGVLARSPDWVNVVALTASRELVCVRQFRFDSRGSVEYSSLIPAGIVDDGEPRHRAARAPSASYGRRRATRRRDWSYLRRGPHRITGPVLDRPLPSTGSTTGVDRDRSAGARPRGEETSRWSSGIPLERTCRGWYGTRACSAHVAGRQRASRAWPTLAGLRPGAKATAG